MKEVNTVAGRVGFDTELTVAVNGREANKRGIMPGRKRLLTDDVVYDVWVRWNGKDWEPVRLRRNTERLTNGGFWPVTPPAKLEDDTVLLGDGRRVNRAASEASNSRRCRRKVRTEDEVQILQV